ncbi:MAG: class II SORL domain-containing protein [Candidatus Nezhaarchaeales archaeon]
MSLKSLIYDKKSAAGEALLKAEAHTPRIEAPDAVKSGEAFSVRVSVGPHPNTVEHHIKWIELYFEEEGRPFNPISLARFDLAPVYSEPAVEARVKLSKAGRLIAVGYCSLHGLWESSKEVRVE